MKFPVPAFRSNAMPGLGRGIVPATLLVVLAAGCGGVGAPPPGWGDNEHSDIEVASTAGDGGNLAVEFDFDEVVEVPFSQCFGGSGADCSGGVRLYSTEEPGFGLLALSEPDESLYTLPDDVSIEIEVTAADPEASLFLEGDTLQEAGDRADLGTTPDLHAHGSWQLAIPADEEPAESYAIAFRLHSADGFGPSAEYVVLLAPVDE